MAKKRTRKQSIGVSLAPRLVEQLDRLVLVDELSRTRNEMIGEAVGQYVKRELARLEAEERETGRITRLLGEFHAREEEARDSHTP